MTESELEGEAHWRDQISDSRYWISTAQRQMAGANAIHELAETLCPGVFDSVNYEVVDRIPEEREKILGLVAASQMQTALAVEVAFVDYRQRSASL